MRKAKETRTEEQCQGIEENLHKKARMQKNKQTNKQTKTRQQQQQQQTNNKNNSKKAYQLVKELASMKQGRTTTIQDKVGKCLTEEQDILKRRTEYCSELYTHTTTGDPMVLDVPSPINNDSYPILQEEVEAVVKSPKKGKPAGLDNIPSELVQAGGEAMIDMLLIICNKIWQTGEWPTPWTQSLIITLPKKGNLQLCQNYRTISLISHPSKVMLRILLNKLKPQAEEIIKEEQAGFRAGRSTTEQIFNLRILCEKYLQHQQSHYHVFVDFKKAFDRVWYAALRTTMRLYSINDNLIRTIECLYNKATSAIYHDKNIGEWFGTTIRVCQGCLLSPTLFNSFLERITANALEDHEGKSVSEAGQLQTYVLLMTFTAYLNKSKSWSSWQITLKRPPQHMVCISVQRRPS